MEYRNSLEYESDFEIPSTDRIHPYTWQNLLVVYSNDMFRYISVTLRWVHTSLLVAEIMNP